MVSNDVIVIGPALTQGGTSPNKENVKGDVMAFDVRTGKKLWVFHTIPRKGEPGYETWLNGSADYTGNAGVWGPFSADDELGYVYLATESPTNDGYGGHRPGANLYSDSLVCLDIKTGKMIWYKQLIHHDIWDYDMPVHPILLDINVNGKPIKAVVQMGKMAFAYVFDRTNGQPVWPIPDVPVPADRRSDRMDVSNAADPDEAARLRRRRSQGRRPDQLHSGASRGGAARPSRDIDWGPPSRRPLWSCRMETREPSWRPASVAARTGNPARRIRRQVSCMSDRSPGRSLPVW